MSYITRWLLLVPYKSLQTLCRLADNLFLFFYVAAIHPGAAIAGKVLPVQTSQKL